MLDQETGLRGYVLSGEDSFLEPFHSGRRDADAALATLDRQLKYKSVQRSGRRSRRSSSPRARGSTTTPIRRSPPRRSNPGGPRSVEQVQAGKARFDHFRATVNRLNVVLGPARQDARQP